MKKKNNELAITIYIFVTLVTFLLSFAGIAEAQKKQTRVTIAAGYVGSGNYILGGAMAKVISKEIPNVSAMAEATTAGVDNLKLVMTRKSDLGYSLMDSAYDALKGVGVFKSLGPTELRTVFASTPPYVAYLVTLDGSGINSIYDLKGKRVGTGGPGSATEVTTLRILESYGIDRDKDFKKERIQAMQACDALKDKKVDAFFWINPLPTALIIDLASTPGIKLKFLNNSEKIEMLWNKYGQVYAKGRISRNIYPNIDSEAEVIAMPIYTYCHEKMDELLVYNIVKAVDKNKAEFEIHKGISVPILPDLKEIESSPVPYHPGVVKYCKEKNN